MFQSLSAWERLVSQAVAGKEQPDCPPAQLGAWMAVPSQPLALPNQPEHRQVDQWGQATVSSHLGYCSVSPADQGLF